MMSRPTRTLRLLLFKLKRNGSGSGKVRRKHKKANLDCQANLLLLIHFG